MRPSRPFPPSFASSLGAPVLRFTRLGWPARLEREQLFCILCAFLLLALCLAPDAQASEE
jgi:hypothetical protein